MTRAGRPSNLKPVSLGVSSILAYQAEVTPGLTPRTPFSRSASSKLAELVVEEADDEDEDAIDVKVHRSPGAPITPLPPRKRRKHLAGSHADPSCAESNPRWRLVTWSAVIALVVIVLLSLYNVDPRHVLLPQARSGAVTDWIDVVSKEAGSTETREIVHPTKTVPVYHQTERPSAAVVAEVGEVF
ncbi:hypothetical protein BDV93DRAFT_608552 [Ceratobasidium sp. AG-I]|nr:hypothetical protein BDV93DRAFT_608552 [Ceratobasidium sp. AG-I]